MFIPIDVPQSLGALALVITAIASLGSMLLSWRNSLKIEEVRHATNSMKDELVKVTGEAEHAKGVVQGRSEIIEAVKP